MGIHVGLHWKLIMDMMKKLVRLPANKVTPWIARILVLGIFLFGSYNIYTTNYFSKANVFASGRKGGFEMRNGGKRGFPTDAERPQNGEVPPDGEVLPDGQFSSDGRFPSFDNQVNVTGDSQQDGKQSSGRPAHNGKGIGKGPGSRKPNGNGPYGSIPGGSNAFGVIIKYISILSVFSAITYYAERLLIRSRLKKAVK